MIRFPSVVIILIAGALAFATTSGHAQSPPGKGRKAKHQDTHAAGRAGDPRALTPPREGNAIDIALEYAREHAPEFGLTAADVHDIVVTSAHVSEHSGVTHVYLRQRFNAIDVHSAEMNINVAKDGRVFGVGTSFVPSLADAISGTSPAIDAVESATAAAKHLGKELKNPIAVIHARGGAAREATLSDGGIAEGPIGVRLVYEPLESGEVALAWLLSIEEAGGSHLWEISVDAANGDLFEQTDLTVHDQWEEPDWNEVGTTLASAESSGAADATEALEEADDLFAVIPVPGVPDSGTYRVWAWPHTDPNNGGRSIAVNPADSESSPYGWHDTNGLDGAESNRTSGNNVDAYLDILNTFPGFPPALPTDAERADGGPGRMFDHPIDLTQSPRAYGAAATTNLFYWNNIVHDVTYRYGFNEAAGNFQVNQYGRFIASPGTTNTGQNDPVRAEAQDGGGMDNANFSTPPDGSAPRMQMFLWVPQGGYQVQALDGAGAGNYNAARANFGAFLADVHVTQPTARVVATSPANACVALAAGSLTDRIAFIESSAECTNVSKVQHAQNAGAVGVILVTTSSSPQPITGISGTITIPVLGITPTAAALLRPTLPFTAKLAFLGVPAPLRDGDFDAGVIVHEYAHGISNRLTGGRLNVSCLGNPEQMGEGWSDFLGLVLTHDPNSPIQRSRGFGPYTQFTGAGGRGIRTTQYSTDMAINPTTYGTTANGTLSVPHGIGYAWATMLWEVYWNLIDTHGFNPNVYDRWDTGGNNLTIQLVMDGMKIQPCSPGFVTGRDAILQADQALTRGANQCAIWRGFAKRGLGVSAVQGSANVLTDNVEAFDVPVACQAAMTVAPLALASTQVPDTVASEQLQVKNATPAGGLDLNWTITETATDCNTPSDLPWLSVSPVGGITSPGATAGASVTLSSTGLGIGTYSGKLCVSAANVPTEAVPISMTVIHDFSGFGSPLAGEGRHERKAGAAAPVKFSLNGFMGMNIFTPGFPASRVVACANGAPVGALEAAVSAAGSALSYDVSTDEYTWVWKTSAEWAGTCREFVLGLDDGTEHTMTFLFR